MPSNLVTLLIRMIHQKRIEVPSNRCEIAPEQRAKNFPVSNLFSNKPEGCYSLQNQPSHAFQWLNHKPLSWIMLTWSTSLHLLDFGAVFLCFFLCDLQQQIFNYHYSVPSVTSTKCQVYGSAKQKLPCSQIYLSCHSV